jgi:lysophospholipase L1-like esterase
VRPALPRWKKLAFACATIVVILVPLYAIGEVSYRRIHGIPVLLRTPEPEPERAALAPGDTRAMDFDSVYYYEIFRESDDPVLFYEPRPGFARGAVRINSQGFRDREFTLEKPAGTIRIAVLGDSVVWGHGIRIEDTFPKQLEELLAERAVGRYEVLNFGVSGYSLQQEVEQFLVRARRFHPDIVILGTSVNDLQYSSVEGDYFQRQNSGIFERSYLKGALATSASYLLTRYFGVPPRYLERIVEVQYHLERAKSADPDVRWMVLMFPLLENFSHYELQWYHDAILDPARRLGFVVHDLRPDFARFPEASLGIDHIHPNRLGNHVAAEAALDTLFQSGWVEPRHAS